PNCQLPNCGDGSIEGPEECEGSTAGATTCQDLGFYTGTLGCMGCHYDTRACAGYCGDGLLNGGEECDDANTTSTLDDVFAGTCIDLGFYNATTIKCDPRCNYD